MPTPSPWETIDLRYPFPGTTGFLASSIFSVPRAPMTSVFEGPGQPPPRPKQGLSNQNKGHLGSRYIYI